MVPDLSKIINDNNFDKGYTTQTESIKTPHGHATSRTLYSVEDKVFLVVNQHTIEIRTEARLGRLLIAKYESIMASRYFGHGGIEIVLANQLPPNELRDLIYLSYNLTILSNISAQ